MLPQAIPTHFPQARLLVVDDEACVRDLLKSMLDETAFEVVCAASLNEARQLFSSQSWDLVITDMCLDGDHCDGLDLIDHIIASDNSTPVILITGFASIPRAVDAIRRGAVNFIPKPFDYEMLLHQINKALQERRLRLENKRLQAEVNKAAVIEKLNRELDQRINELYRLYTISEGLNDFVESGEIFERIAKLAAEVTDAQRVAVLIFDRARKRLRVKAAIGLTLDRLRGMSLETGEGCIGRAALEGRAVYAIRTGMPSTPGANGQPTPFETAELPCGLAMPLKVAGEVFGVIALDSKAGGEPFAQEDEQTLVALVEKAGIRLENQALYEGIYSNLVDTLNALVTSLEAKDPYTREHSQRVTDYGVALARYLHLDEDAIEMIHFAGMLHDIGKIGVRDGILTKSGRLTDEEYELIKQHPIIGDRIVKPLGLVQAERAIIRHHHERFDGRGYPDGLRGEEIPLLARIISVADAFDAMTTTRSYRFAMPVSVALAEMSRCSGSQFDPSIVKLWMEAIASGKIMINVPEPVQMPFAASAH